MEKQSSSGDEVYFYGADGKLLTIFTGTSQFQISASRVYFGSMLLGSTNGTTTSDAPVFADRLGTVTPGYPYGTAIGSTAGNDQVDFATYLKDGSTGLDYAVNRYYTSTFGNFTSPDPSMDNVDYTSPESWNANAYGDGDPINGDDPSGLQTCGQVPIQGGAFSGMTVGQVFTGTSGNDLLAQEIWHEGGTIYQSDLTSPASASAYALDLAAIGTAILNQWDVDNGPLRVYQNGRAVCPLGHCLGRSLAQIIEIIATYNSDSGLVSTFNSSGQMQGPAATTLAGILGTNIDSPPTVMDIDGQSINQGCEGVAASLVTASGLLDGSISRVSPNGLTLLFWNQASASSTTDFPGSVGYIGWQDARQKGETFWACRARLLRRSGGRCRRPEGDVKETWR